MSRTGLERTNRESHGLAGRNDESQVFQKMSSRRVQQEKSEECQGFQQEGMMSRSAGG